MRTSGNIYGALDDRNCYLPSEEEIKEACLKIQAGWTKEERDRRISSGGTGGKGPGCKQSTKGIDRVPGIRVISTKIAFPYGWDCHSSVLCDSDE